MAVYGYSLLIFFLLCYRRLPTRHWHKHKQTKSTLHWTGAFVLLILAGSLLAEQFLHGGVLFTATAFLLATVRSENTWLVILGAATGISLSISNQILQHQGPARPILKLPGDNQIFLPRISTLFALGLFVCALIISNNFPRLNSIKTEFFELQFSELITRGNKDLAIRWQEPRFLLNTQNFLQSMAREDGFEKNTLATARFLQSYPDLYDVSAEIAGNDFFREFIWPVAVVSHRALVEQQMPAELVRQKTRVMVAALQRMLINPSYWSSKKQLNALAKQLSTSYIEIASLDGDPREACDAVSKNSCKQSLPSHTVRKEWPFKTGFTHLAGSSIFYQSLANMMWFNGDSDAAINLLRDLTQHGRGVHFGTLRKNLTDAQTQRLKNDPDIAILLGMLLYYSNYSPEDALQAAESIIAISEERLRLPEVTNDQDKKGKLNNIILAMKNNIAYHLAQLGRAETRAKLYAGQILKEDPDNTSYLGTSCYVQMVFAAMAKPPRTSEVIKARNDLERLKVMLEDEKNVHTGTLRENSDLILVESHLEQADVIIERLRAHETADE